MTDPDAEALVEDAKIDGIGGGSWFGGFVKGVLLGGLGSAVAVLGLTLSQPLPSHLPGVGRVEVVQSSGSAADAVQEETAENKPDPEVAAVEPDDAAETSEENAAPAEQDEAATSEDADSQNQAVDAAPSESQEQEAAATNSEEQVELAAAPTADEPEADGPVTEPDQTGAVADTEETQQAVLAPTEEEAVPPAADAEQTGTGATDAEVSDVEEVVETAALVPVPPLSLSGPAVEVNARPFDAPPNAPLLAVVLEDPGKSGLAPGAMALLTMPLTFAIRPDREGADELAGAARLAGHEILAQLPLIAPDGNAETPTAFSRATSPDALANVTRRVLADLDVAIGATVPTGAAIANDRRAMEAILAPLGENGFAYLDLKSGIGSTAQRISEGAGFSYAESNRYAEEAASENEIYQMLDGAAFQARRQGSAIVTVGATSNALKAIVRWGLERGGQEVWFAPLSAVLAKRNEG